MFHNLVIQIQFDIFSVLGNSHSFTLKITSIFFVTFVKTTPNDLHHTCIKIL